MTKRRKHISLQVKLSAALNALGLLGQKIAYDHRPPLSHRPFLKETGDYDPPELDPRYLFPILAETNKALADGDQRPLSGDTSVAAKLKRIDAKRAAFRERLLAKDSGESAPAPKRKGRKMQSRPFGR